MENTTHVSDAVSEVPFEGKRMSVPRTTKKMYDPVHVFEKVANSNLKMTLIFSVMFISNANLPNIVTRRIVPRGVLKNHFTQNFTPQMGTLAILSLIMQPREPCAG